MPPSAWPGYLQDLSPTAQDVVFGRFIKTYQESWKPEYVAALEDELQPYFKSVPSPA